jgi:AI-2 transport protein TqsA
MEQPVTEKKLKLETIAAALIIVALSMFCLIYFSGFLQPFVLAVMVWYFIYELREAGTMITIRGKKLPRWLLTILAFVIIILIIFAIVEILTDNIELIRRRLPDYLVNLRTMLSNVQKIEGFEEVQQRFIERIQTFDFNPLLTGILNGVSGIAGNIFLIIIYVFFLLAEDRLFTRKMKLLVRDPVRQNSFRSIVQQVHSAIRTYVYVKTMMSVLTAVLSYFILLLFKVDFPILWALIIFLLNYIPYVGSLVATLLPAAFAMFQFQSFAVFLWLVLAIQVVQIAVGNVLEPKVMGKTLNLSPLGVLLALTFWGIIWGVIGMILSVPITSLLVIIASRFSSTRFIAVLLSETGELPADPPLGPTISG